MLLVLKLQAILLSFNHNDRCVSLELRPADGLVYQLKTKSLLAVHWAMFQLSHPILQFSHIKFQGLSKAAKLVKTNGSCEASFFYLLLVFYALQATAILPFGGR